MICLYAYVSYINHHIIHAWITTGTNLFRFSSPCNLVPPCATLQPLQTLRKGFPGLWVASHEVWTSS